MRGQILGKSTIQIRDQALNTKQKKDTDINN
eukprot:CAMPEP_0116899012 /NCGR_PEP_ID=MMETSP0467-20121206/7654_1 /TAXON_ID=283647 /ORGANISM="Mesodinium pulex, Strain SPMC105" /LENGTH=30 /DNA_ID= /DNA_START= /DNA_END= /DNA_ORIENTATION=